MAKNKVGIVREKITVGTDLTLPCCASLSLRTSSVRLSLGAGADEALYVQALMLTLSHLHHRDLIVDLRSWRFVPETICTVLDGLSRVIAKRNQTVILEVSESTHLPACIWSTTIEIVVRASFEPQVAA